MAGRWMDQTRNTTVRKSIFCRTVFLLLVDDVLGVAVGILLTAPENPTMGILLYLYPLCSNGLGAFLMDPVALPSKERDKTVRRVIFVTELVVGAVLVVEKA
jgi:hypothetical protein